MVNQADVDYNMLTIYSNNLQRRIWLLKIDFKLLKEVLNEPDKYEIPPGEKTVTYAISIQLNIISKIMMLIEDFVVIAKSFLMGKNFYQNSLSPGSPELGPIIREFFDTASLLSDEEILSIMNWIKTNKVTSDDKVALILDKFLSDNVSYIRQFLKELRKFGKSNHDLYRRFKHGGSPINSDSGFKPLEGPLREFDAFSITSVGGDPFSDIHIIPFSLTIIDRYLVLVNELEKIITEMIRNRIESLERGIGGVIPNLNRNNLSILDPDFIVGKYIQNFNDNHPFSRFLKPITYNMSDSIYEKIPWYLD